MADAKLRLQIETVLKDKGLIDANARIVDLEKGLGRAKASAKAAAGAFSEIDKSIAGFVGGAALAQFIRTSVVEFAKVERGFNAIGYAMRGLGINAETDLPRVKAFLEAIEAGGGPMVSETVPAFQKMIGITKDTSAALYAVKLATDVAESGQVDMAAALDGIAAIMQGKAKSAAQAFGLELFKTNGEQKTNVELLDEVIKKYEGLGEKISDSQNAMDQANAVWQSTLRTVGEGFSVVLPAVTSALFHIVAWFKDWGSVAGGVFNLIIEGAPKVGNVLKNAFNLWKLETDPVGWWNDLTSSAADAASVVKENLATIWQDVSKNHTREVAETKTTEDAKARIIAQARRAKAKDLEDETRKLAEEDEKRREKHAQFLQQIISLEADAAKQVEQARIDAMEEGSQEWLAARLAQLKTQMDAELDNALLTEQAKEDIRERYALLANAAMARSNQMVMAQFQALVDAQRQSIDAQIEFYRGWALIQQTVDGDNIAARTQNFELGLERERAAFEFDLSDRQEKWRAEGIAEAAIRKRSEAEVTEFERNATRKRIEFSRQEAMAKLNGLFAVADATVAFAQQAFGDSKDAAVGIALINMAVGITKIWASWGEYPIVAGILTAIEAAACFEQIDRIEAQQAPASTVTRKGFDDPMNDRAAYFGGRKWADDIIQNVGSGFRDGLAVRGFASEAMPQQTINTYATEYSQPTVVFNGPVIGGEQGKRELVRVIAEATRRDRARFLG